MNCCVNGCENEAKYKAACLCQKHYFRKIRYGTTELVRAKARPKITMPGRGYQLVHDPKHPVAHSNGYVYEHRKVAFGIFGLSMCSCTLCGASVNWKTVHIDHIDNDPRNNQASNLRPLCRSCNVHRSYPERHTFKSNHAITFGDVTLTAQEWARLTGGFLSGATIARRVNSGMSAEAALFTTKATHGKNTFPPYSHEGLIELAKYYRTAALKTKKENP